MCLLTYSSQHTQSYRILAALATSQPKTLRRTAKVHRERFDSPSGFAVERFCKWNWSDEEYAVPFAFLIHDSYIELLFVYLSHCVYIDQRWAPPSHVAATCKPRSSVKMEPNVRIFTATDTCMCNVFADAAQAKIQRYNSQWQKVFFTAQRLNSNCRNQQRPRYLYIQIHTSTT